MIIKSAGTQKEATVLEIIPKVDNPVLDYNIDYDSCMPEKTIRDFVKSIKDMISRYSANKDRIVQIEAELQDLYHYIEITPYKTVPKGYKLYRKMAELRRERRACKNEIDLLQPIWEYFHATEVLNRLSRVQGDCAKLKATIDARVYMLRTNILEEVDPKETVSDDLVTVDFTGDSHEEEAKMAESL